MLFFAPIAEAHDKLHMTIVYIAIFIRAGFTDFRFKTHKGEPFNLSWFRQFLFLHQRKSFLILKSFAYRSIPLPTLTLKRFYKIFFTT